jgi:hypothetical protein
VHADLGRCGLLFAGECRRCRCKMQSAAFRVYTHRTTCACVGTRARRNCWRVLKLALQKERSTGGQAWCRMPAAMSLTSCICPLWTPFLSHVASSRPYCVAGQLPSGKAGTAGEAKSPSPTPSSARPAPTTTHTLFSTALSFLGRESGEEVLPSLVSVFWTRSASQHRLLL